MYLTWEQFTVPSAEALDFIARDQGVAELLATRQGFHEGLLLNSLGYPARFALMTEWSSREDSQVFHQDPDWRAFNREHPADPWTLPSLLGEAYEIIHEIRKSGNAAAATLVEWEIESRRGNAELFEKRNQQLFDLMDSYSAGLTAMQLLRFLGNSTRYLVVSLYSTMDAVRGRDRALEIQAFYEDHPASRYTNVPRVVEYSQVVRQTKPGAAS